MPPHAIIPQSHDETWQKCLVDRCMTSIQVSIKPGASCLLQIPSHSAKPHTQVFAVPGVCAVALTDGARRLFKHGRRPNYKLHMIEGNHNSVSTVTVSRRTTTLDNRYKSIHSALKIILDNPPSYMTNSIHVLTSKSIITSVYHLI